MTRTSGLDHQDDSATQEAEDWFLRLTSGSAMESDFQAFKVWRDADPRHQAAFEEVRTLWRDLGELRAAFTDVSDAALHGTDGTDGRGSRVGGVPAAAAGQRRRFARRWAAGGLMAACLALAGIFAADLPTRLRADHRTGVGEQARFLLPDGTTAYLNTDSAIALDYSNGRRRILLLRGEALFDVKKDAERPFDVSLLDGRSTAVGTAFAARRKGEEAIVTVLEGRVSVASPEPRAAAGVTLRANQQVRYHRGEAPGEVVQVDAAAVAAWRQGTLVIDALPLAEAVAEVDRYHEGKVLYLGAGDVGRERVTARIALDEIDGGLRALATVHGLTVIHVTDYLVIVR